VSGGASITIDGGAITVECPGKILVQAGQRSFVGGGTMSHAMPSMPRSACKGCLLNAMKQGAPGVLV
jgi:type VI secretion system secreted protein VgrG